MAQRIEGPYDFTKYSFTQYNDGATWELEAGVDYTVTSGALIANARKWAASEGLEVDVRRLDAVPATRTSAGQPERVALRFRAAAPSNVHKLA